MDELVLSKSPLSSRKQSGAYYTPQDVANALVRWSVRRDSDKMIDPSCGDGRFLAEHGRCVGIDQDTGAIQAAAERAPWAIVHQCDFFQWAASTAERFDCAAGNPPFIRYQTFKGELRTRALQLCEALGARFSGLTSSWAPFLVAAASVLKPSGRMAFVVPAEIGHAPYAVPLIDYLLDNFQNVHIVAVREKFFLSLSEDCWLLFADGFGEKSNRILFSSIPQFSTSFQLSPNPDSISRREWKSVWNCRLRPFLLPRKARDLYLKIVRNPDSKRFGEFASLGIGYVSGANSFFHLRPSEVASMGIPESLLCPTVRSGRDLPDMHLTAETIADWRQSDDPMMLLRIPKTARVPSNVRRYLDSERGQIARQSYKCRSRDPWYSVPDVRIPDYFLTYMSGVSPSLVKNAAAATCTNALHAVRLTDHKLADWILDRWRTPFVWLSCEIEGHALGGGMLKLEPREAARVVFPEPSAFLATSETEILEAVQTMRSWRHYALANA